RVASPLSGGRPPGLRGGGRRLPPGAPSPGHPNRPAGGLTPNAREMRPSPTWRLRAASRPGRGGRRPDDVDRLSQRLAGLFGRSLARPLRRPLLPRCFLVARVTPLPLLPQSLPPHVHQQHPVAPLPALAGLFTQPLA